MVSLQSSHMPCVGSLFSRYPSRLAWSRRNLLTRLCVGSLFARYSSRLAWSHRGLLTRLAWARCSRGIHHAWRGLVAIFSHAFAWARCSCGIRHAWRGLVAVFSHALPGLVVLIRMVVAAPFHGLREVGLWREIIDCMEKNLQTSYCALPLYLSFPLWNHSLPARLTQFLPSSS